jgi:proton-translocating NADH-quinone oxidoreductase chain N
MDSANWIWAIALPILASPLVYLAGRATERALRAGAARRASGAPPGSAAGTAAHNPSANPARWIGLASLLAACVPLGFAWRDLAAGTSPVFSFGVVALRFDGVSLLLSTAILGLGVLVSLFSGPYIRHDPGQEKFHALLNVMIGAMVGLVCAADLFNLWIWFETMAVASYMLVAFHSSRPASLEAGVKYLVQSSAGSLLVLIGIGLVFSQTGTLELGSLRALILGGGISRTLLLASGSLFAVGFGVKIALVPLHTWLPDAHSQAPSGISAMLSGVVIETGLIALLRSLSVLSGSSAGWGPLFLVFGAVNMLVGNLLALRQTQVKRLLAFSSLSHVGYMLLGIGTAISFGQLDGARGGMFHLFTHAAMKGLAFLAAGCLLFALRIARGNEEPLTAEDLAGASRRYPLAAFALSVALLGLGGLPPFAGFMSKWQIFVAGFHTGNPFAIALVVFAILNSLLSLAYYTPLVSMMYRREPSAMVSAGARVPALMSVPLVLLVALVLVFGVWPTLANGVTVPAGQAVLALFSSKGGM